MSDTTKGYRLKPGTTTKPRRCFVPIRMPGLPVPVACGDRVLKAGRCAEHFADWKNAKQARALAPITETRVDPPRTKKRPGRGGQEYDDARVMAAHMKRVRKGEKRLAVWGAA